LGIGSPFKKPFGSIQRIVGDLEVRRLDIEGDDAPLLLAGNLRPNLLFIHGAAPASDFFLAVSTLSFDHGPYSDARNSL